MTPQKIAALEAQVDALDRATARRVARLVLECRSSLELALLAVQDADQAAQPELRASKRPYVRGRLARALGHIVAR
jgi:hypothetical protein